MMTASVMTRMAGTSCRRAQPRTTPPAARVTPHGMAVSRPLTRVTPHGMAVSLTRVTPSPLLQGSASYGAVACSTLSVRARLRSLCKGDVRAVGDVLAVRSPLHTLRRPPTRSHDTRRTRRGPCSALPVPRCRPPMEPFPRASTPSGPLPDSYRPVPSRTCCAPPSRTCCAPPSRTCCAPPSRTCCAPPCNQDMCW